MKFDVFGASTNFNYGSNGSKFRSSLGACLYLSAMLLTLIFTAMQVLIVHQRSRTTFTSSKLINHQEPSYSFGPQEGFRIAFAIFDESSPTTFQQDDLVKMEVKQFVFKYNADGTWSTEDLTIPSFPCKEEDLEQFYPV